MQAQPVQTPQAGKSKISNGAILGLSVMGLLVAYVAYTIIAPSVKPLNPNANTLNPDSSDPNALTFGVNAVTEGYPVIRQQPSAAAAWVVQPALGSFAGHVNKIQYQSAQPTDWLKIQTVGLGIGYILRSDLQ